MKLHAGPTSPFVRKVRVFALETGLDARIEQIPCTLTPIAPAPALNRDNPIGKIPCLITDDGQALYVVGCEHRARGAA